MFHIAEHIKQLRAYTPGKPVEEVEKEYGISDSIKLASNENPWGCSLKVINEVNKALKSIHVYPDMNTHYVKNNIADFYKIKEDNVIVGNGSGEIIDIIIKVLSAAKTNIVMGEFSFLLYRLLAAFYNIKINYAKHENFKLTAKNIIQSCNSHTSMIIIDNPCNPTGQIINYSELKKIIDFAKNNKIIVLIDEAYHEYVRDSGYSSCLNLINEYQNLIIVKTFSKVYGLSGIRAGFAVAQKDLINLLLKARVPFNVNSLAQVAVPVALQDQDFVNNTIKKTHEGIDYFYKEFKKLNINYVQTQSNFIMFQAPLSQNFCHKLLKQGLIIRSVGKLNDKELLRVSVGTMEQNKKFINALNFCLFSKGISNYE